MPSFFCISVFRFSLPVCDECCSARQPDEVKEIIPLLSANSEKSGKKEEKETKRIE
jgi:hypothetical protein